MGLDQSLTIRISLISDNEIKKELEDSLFKIRGLTNGAGLGITEIAVEAGYWRKANAIHKWFVDRVQGGTDDCGEYPVELEQLQELSDICQYLLANPNYAQDLLPTGFGFFFGSQEYGDDYWSNLEKTVKIIKRVQTAMSQLSDISYPILTYSSSW